MLRKSRLEGADIAVLSHGSLKGSEMRVCPPPTRTGDVYETYRGFPPASLTARVSVSPGGRSLGQRHELDQRSQLHQRLATSPRGGAVTELEGGGDGSLGREKFQQLARLS